MDHALSRHVDVSRDGSTIIVHVPLTVRRSGGRKHILSPPGEPAWLPPGPRINTPLLGALVRAFHWQQLLENGRYATVMELAKAEQMNASYVAHVLRLMLLAPDIVEAILDGRQPSTAQLQPLIRNSFPSEWGEQRRKMMAG